MGKHDIMEKKQKEKEKRETPIIDGDARPDMPLDAGETDRKKNKKPETGKKFETERLSDTNSLEDYKDAK